ncbi:MAG: hypothetical protein FJZ75_06285 [Bacteroidetes bacterium]|nr:hypothetical protein [Bacteroidota bacterium]
MAKPHSWQAKFAKPYSAQLKRVDKPMMGMPGGSLMYISTPAEIEAYITQIPRGVWIDVPTLRNDLAQIHGADWTCPLTTGIFLRILAEAHFERFREGISNEPTCPFWRVISPSSPLAKKLSFGPDYILEKRKEEQG